MASCLLNNLFQQTIDICDKEWGRAQQYVMLYETGVGR